jgi:hypothetical protein
MPTVGLYGPRKVSTEALPAARKSAAETPTSTGAGLELARARQFGAVADLGDTGVRVGLALGQQQTRERQQETERADDVALMNAQNRLDQTVTGILYDPEKGALNKKGPASFSTPEQTATDYNTAAGEIARSLSTDRQRLAFQKLAGNKASQLDLTVRRHVAEQITQYEAGELTSLVANAKNNAIANAGDPELVGLELTRAVAAIKKSGPRLGLGPEEVQQQVEATQSNTIAGVIDSLLAQENTKAAHAYFDEASSLLTGPDKTRIQKALAVGTLRAESQKQADAILAGGGTLKDQLGKAKAIDDPETRDAVEQRLEHANALKDRDDAEAEKGRLNDAYQLLDQNGGNMAKIPPSLLVDLGVHLPALRSYAEHRAKGTPVETDLGTYYSRMQEAGDNPEAFVKRNLLADRGRLGESEFKQLTNLQLSLKSGDRAKSDPELAGFQTRTQIVDDALSLYGIDPNAKATTTEGKAIAQLRRMLDRRVDAAQQPDASGKRVKVSNAEMQKTVDELMSQTETVPGSWWNFWPGGKSVSDTTKRLVDTTIEDVPTPARQAIEQRLRARGKPVTDQTILDVFLESKIK